MSICKADFKLLKHIYSLKQRLPDAQITANFYYH